MSKIIINFDKGSSNWSSHMNANKIFTKITLGCLNEQRKLFGYLTVSEIVEELDCLKTAEMFGKGWMADDIFYYEEVYLKDMIKIILYVPRENLFIEASGV